MTSHLVSRSVVAAASLALVVSACGDSGGGDGDRSLGRTLSGLEVATTTTTAAAAPVTPAPAPPTSPPTTIAPRPTTTRAPRPRVVHEQAWTSFAAAGGVTLRHPSARVERVGFHESNHDGARALDVLPGAADPVDLESRERGTAGRTAVDVVSDPDFEIRSPVTGRVKRAGTYVLYCKHRDDFVVIEPDDHAGWEVKILHIDGVQVRPGDRVTAGETVLAPRPTRLPFASQVDETTATPPWPHVHIEVVDPSIRDRPGPGC